MNAAALIFAVLGAAITFIGFGFANKFESGFFRFFAKIAALAAGFCSMPALESMLNVKGASAAGSYWAYLMIGYWLITQGLGASGKGGK